MEMQRWSLVLSMMSTIQVKDNFNKKAASYHAVTLSVDREKKHLQLFLQVN
jgi:hypothetical protein